MDRQNRTARFEIESGASPANLRDVFHRIGDYCRRTAGHAVIVCVAGYVAVSSDQLLSAVASLAAITARAFFDESSAHRWLSW